ncbi:hypothetical protein PINS_up005397 [Pythium insidiosum]|nr:hypothetical protein PINS_up005397 [Pythium insidiosum]
MVGKHTSHLPTTFERPFGANKRKTSTHPASSSRCWIKLKMTSAVSRKHGAVVSVCLVWMLSLLSVPVVDAVETTFARRFRYENSVQRPVAEMIVVDEEDAELHANLSTSPPPATSHQSDKNTSGSTKRRIVDPRATTSYGAMSSLVRWNTFTILSSFGMEVGGRVTIDISNLTYLSFPANVSTRQVPVVFTLYDIDQWRAYSVLQLREMPIKSPTLLCHYPAAMRYTITERKFQLRESSRRVFFDVIKPSLYTLQVQVCGDASVYVAGQASMVNIGFDGQLSEHLGVEELGLIPLYKALVVTYTCFTALWIAECIMQRKIVPRISYALQVALHVKTLEVFIKTWYYQEFSRRGHRDSMFKMTQDATESISCAAMLVVMLLAALGWSLTRDELSRREIRLISVSFGCYFCIALAKASCDFEDDVCKAYMLTEYIIRSVMMLGVIIALNITISQLRLALTEARWNNVVTPLTYMKLDQLQRFRFVFLLYLLIPTTLLILNLLVITPAGSWRYDWVNFFLSECTTLFINVNVALILRPLDSFIFSRLVRGTDEGEASHPLSPTIIGRSVVLPHITGSGRSASTQPLSAEETIASNRRLLQAYASSSSGPPHSTTNQRSEELDADSPGIQIPSSRQFGPHGMAPM